VSNESSDETTKRCPLSAAVVDDVEALDFRDFNESLSAAYREEGGGAAASVRLQQPTHHHVTSDINRVN
jgi:hypothetical protein